MTGPDDKLGDLRSLLEELQGRPDQNVSVIVYYSGELTEDRLRKLRTLHTVVKHRFSLIRAFSADVPLMSLNDVAEEPWVTRIEPDREVKAL